MTIVLNMVFFIVYYVQDGQSHESPPEYTRCTEFLLIFRLLLHVRVREWHEAAGTAVEVREAILERVRPGDPGAVLPVHLPAGDPLVRRVHLPHHPNPFLPGHAQQEPQRTPSLPYR